MLLNLARNTIYSAINTLPKKMQLKSVERFIFENNFINDLIDLNIAKQRLNETGIDYEEFRKKEEDERK